MRSFWQHASTQQRLAQIDGAISVGMTMRQTAMNLGTTRGAIEYFTIKHGRSFAPNSTVGTEASKKINRLTVARKHGAPNVLMTDAFEIFPSRAKTAEFLEKREYD